MKNTIKFRLAGIGIMLVTCAVFGAAVMLLWNALMPQIFAFPQISYLQAAGLLILTRILFGGIGGGRRNLIAHRGAGEDRLFHHGNKLREKWMNMSADERKEFLEKEKDFFKFNRRFSRFHEFFDNEDERTKDERNE
ncbi:MAG: hypothetical protein LBB89_11960 [Treponema sp.]|jgi:hypothetical protein|nr:hypothetical protein [Treponema sp.]